MPHPGIAQSTVTVPQDRIAAVQLATAKQQIEDGSFEAAAKFLIEIAETRGARLVRISPTQLVRVRDRCYQLMLQLPPERLSAIRTRQEAAARLWLERAKRDEPEVLHRLLHEAPFSAAADEALFRLASDAWQAGQPGLAYEYWRRLLPVALNSADPRRYAGSQYGSADIAARLVLCRIAMNDKNLARRELVGFRKAFPDSEGNLAGEQGRLADILQRQVEANWSQPESARSIGDWETIWVRSRPRMDAALAKPVRSRVPAERVVFSAGRAFLLSEKRVTEVDTQGGQKLDLLDQTVALAVATDVVEHRDKLFVCGSDARGRSQLICLLAGSGRVVWRIESNDIIAGASFDCGPACSERIGLVVLRSNEADGALHLCGLNLDDGSVRFRSLLCTGLGTADEPHVPIRPLVSSSHLTIVTNRGVVIATDRAGRLVWATEYSRTERRSSVGATGIAKHGQLIIAPADSDTVLALREHTGGLIWSTRLPDRIRHVVGVESGLCLLAGRSPWGLEFGTGRVRWGTPRYVPEQFGFGAPRLVGGSLLFPTRESVEVRDCERGGSLSVKITVPGGNLSFEPGSGRLAVASGTQSLLKSRTSD